MGKGDHVFNNVKKSFFRGYWAGFLRFAELKPDAGVAFAQTGNVDDGWLRLHMPNAWPAIEVFDRNQCLTVLREELQTRSFQGGDPNNEAYSGANDAFRKASVEFFEEVALKKRNKDYSMLLEVKKVRKAFYHVCGNAEDPNARDRMFSEQRNSSAVQAKYKTVKQDLQWGWARCEFLYRMTAKDLWYL
jgi:hypothetical protein